MDLKFTPKDNSEALKDIHTFFGTSLREYYMTIESKEFKYQGEGYAIIGQNNISFFDEKMAGIYSVQLHTAHEAKINGMQQDDITMKFDDGISINAER